MGLLDRFRHQSEPDEEFAASPVPPTVPRGGSGRWHTDGFIDPDEINQKLVGRAGLEVFQKMWRTDPDARRILTMCVAPMAAATWAVDPYHDEDAEPTAQDLERAAFVNWALMEAMRPGWKAHLWTSLTVGARDGFAPFEQLYRLATWRGRKVWTIDTLDLRLPRSVDRWAQSGHRLIGIEQFETGSMAQGWSRAQIPAADLVYYRWGAEGDNWEGQSLLRPAYKNWHYKDSLELIDSIGHERTHIGIPAGYPPISAQEGDLDDFEEILANIRASDAGYFMAPGPHAAHSEKGQGWLVEILTSNMSEGAATALHESLKHHRASMDAAVLAEFMRLGQAGEGARATADVQQNPFWQLVESLAGMVVEDPINEQLIPRLLGWNFDVSDGRLPKLRCSLIDSTSLEGLASYVATLAREKAIRVEPRLEAYLREVADLPEADEDAIAERDEKAMEIARQAGPKVGDDDDDRPPAPERQDRSQEAHRHDVDVVTLARQDRDLRPWEQHMSLDRIESAIVDARDRLQAAAGEEARRMAVDLARVAAGGGRIIPTPGPEGLARAVAGELLDLYATGRDTVREELDRQGGGLATTLELDDTDAGHLEEFGQDAADRVRADVAAALARTRMREGGTPDLVAAIVTAEQAAHGAVRAVAQDFAAGALNLGRAREADERADEIEGAYYTSILDGNRCLAEGVLVTTPLGPVPVERINPGDEVVSHTGRARRVTSVHVSDVEEQLIRIAVGDGTLLVTADHPVLVGTDRGLTWRNAGDLSVGDLVALDHRLQGVGESVADDLVLGHSPHDESSVLDVERLADVDPAPLGVPVVAVGLDDERVADEEVHDPRPDLRLRAEREMLVLEDLADEPLDAGLGVAGAVAPDAAVSTLARGGRHDAERRAAVRAVDVDGGSSACLGAVSPEGARSASAAEGGAASLAGGVLPAVGARTLPGAVVVASSVGHWDAEEACAADARLGDPVGPAFGRAVGNATFEPVGELAAAALAGGRRVGRPTRHAARLSLESSFGGDAPSPLGRAALASHPPGDSGTAVHTHLVHDCIVWTPVDVIERLPYVGAVYDLTVETDHTLWANGVLVHNCDACRDADDDVLRALDDPVRLARMPPNAGCHGGPRCRCMESFVRRSESTPLA